MDIRENIDLKNNSISNAVIDASSNTVSNITVSNLASGVLDTDLTSVSGTHNTVPSALSVKNYVDGAVTGSDHDAGDFDASGGYVPAIGTGVASAIMKGDYWRITVAGTITGVTPNASLQVGDVLYAKVDGASAGSQFFAVQGNLNAATTTVTGTVMLATEADAKAKTDMAKAVTPADLSTFARQAKVTVTTDNTATAHTVVHNMAKPLEELTVQLRDGTTGVQFIAAISKSGSNVTNQFVVTCSPAYPVGSYLVLVTTL